MRLSAEIMPHGLVPAPPHPSTSMGAPAGVDVIAMTGGRGPHPRDQDPIPWAGPGLSCQPHFLSLLE